MVAGVLWVVVSALALGLGSLAQGAAAARHRGRFSALLVHPLFLLGLAGDAVGFGAHAMALHRVSMAVAQGSVTGSLAVAALGARWVTGRRLDRSGVLAVLVIGGGLVALAAVTGDAGTPSDPAGLEVGLAAAAAVLALAAGAATLGRTPARRGPALALVSGLAFAVCSVAVRLVGGTTVLDTLTDPALLVAGAAAAVGGLTWAAALRDGSITAVTAIVVAAEVVPPSLLGPWLLGDTVATGFVAVAPLVLLATVVAGGVLSRGGHPDDRGQRAGRSARPEGGNGGDTDRLRLTAASPDGAAAPSRG